MTPASVPGLAARQVAADILDAVLRRGRPLDELFDGRQAPPGLVVLSERDRALARHLVSTVLRRLGSLRHILHSLLERGLPAKAPRVETALLIGAAQILWLDVPDHAAVDLAVRVARADRQALHYADLVNGVLRRIAREKTLLSGLDHVARDTPVWLMNRWTAAYGEERAREIAAANEREAALDLTMKGDPQSWAERLSARILPTGSLRLIAHGPVSALPGYDEGAWWVQDAAAAIPARLFGDVRGWRVADLCAAPGGKTAQLAQAGAQVTAVDRSASRLARLETNLARLKLHATAVLADASEWTADPFDAILLDAPCSSTGTIRRHPDVPWLKHEGDLVKLTALQGRLLDRAADLINPPERLSIRSCSLEPEGETAIAAFLSRHPKFRRKPIRADEFAGLSDFVTPQEICGPCPVSGRIPIRAWPGSMDSSPQGS